jgi:hypothetical protein
MALPPSAKGSQWIKPIMQVFGLDIQREIGRRRVLFLARKPQIFRGRTAEFNHADALYPFTADTN